GPSQPLPIFRPPILRARSFRWPLRRPRVLMPIRQRLPFLVPDLATRPPESGSATGRATATGPRRAPELSALVPDEESLRRQAVRRCLAEKYTGPRDTPRLIQKVRARRA